MYFCLIIQITYLKIFKTRLNYVEVLHKLLGLVLIESIFNASAFCLTVLVTYFMYKQVNQLKKTASVRCSCDFLSSWYQIPIDLQ